MQDQVQQGTDQATLDNQTVDTSMQGTDTTTQTGSESHVESQNTIATSDNSQIESQRNLERERGKMSQLERERNDAQKAYESQMAWVLASEARTREYLKDVQGLNDDAVNQRLTTIKQQHPNLWQSQTNEQTAQAQTQQPIDINQISQQARVVAREELFIAESQRNFFKLVPELDPEKVASLSPEQRQAKSYLADAIERFAKEEARQQGYSYPTAEMLHKAYKALVPQPNLDQVRRDGELEGLAKANAVNAATFGSPSATASQSTNVNLTESERKIADSLSMSYADYAKYKQEY
jgi:hypothetical protein